MMKRTRNVYSIVFLCFLGVYGVNAQEGITTNRPDTIPSGVQGSVNPLKDEVYVLSGDDLLDKSFPNSIPLFGTNIRFSVGGYVKADFIQDFDYVGDRYEFELGSIAVEGTPEREQGGVSTFHVKESRVNFEFRSQAKWINGNELPMRAFVEIDWFFDNPAMALNTRLRQAYGTIGRITIGRTWNTSSDLTAIPGLIDFSGGDALYGGRVNQIKWMDNFGKSFTYAIAVEEFYPQVSNPLNYTGADRPMWPNISGMIKYHAEKGSTAQLGLDVFPVNWKGAGQVSNSEKTGYALTLMSRIVFSGGHNYDALVWGGGYGLGQAHKIIALSWDGKGSGAITPEGIELAPAYFGYIGFNHYWSKSFNSTISTNWAGTELPEIQTDGTIKMAGSAHVNLIWFPYKLISTGIEYMWGMRENKDGTRGTASRIQFMAKFKFH